MSVEQEKYHDNINCKFAEAVYQNMGSIRYGIKFCCQTELDKLEIAKELLKLNDIANASLPEE